MFAAVSRRTALALFALAALPAQAADAVFDLPLRGGALPQNLRRIRVRQGDTVRLRWTSDRPIVLHLHGYDIELAVEPGRSAEMTFEARAAGRFSVEEHTPGGAHGAPLVRIDVLPR